MEPQKSIDYDAMFSGLISRHAQLVQDRNEIDRELTKLKQLILASFPLISADKQALFQAEIEELEEQSGGLLNAIKLVFSAHKGEWLTPSQVRDYLGEMGFDVAQYKANPLASIGTTLRRMAPGHLEAKTDESGQILYQRRMTYLDQVALEARRAHVYDALKAGQAAARKMMSEPEKRKTK